ncbi:MAG TPA: hypothetical protein VK498_05200 [Ferruginibacter sp.]|nr:hypothetical protein [Ferruginibacter sp.]
MKSTITAILIIITNTGIAQLSLIPNKNSFEKKWIKTETYEMQWFALKDTTRIEIGVVSTHIQSDKKYISIVTEVKMKNAKAPWFDTTIANRRTLKPIRHSSYNSQRDMAINFDKIITGFYHDKIKQQHYFINDTTSAAYFDSNLYPALITWLPLKEGYKQDISIYDYNPSGKTGVIRAFVKNVTSGTYLTNSSVIMHVWIVTVSDEISSNENNFMTYYIDKNDRKLWKQEIHVEGRRMVMLRKEEGKQLR